MSNEKLYNSKLYKNLGVDVEFVANNANTQNDKMNDYFNSGKKKSGPIVSPSSISRSAPAPAEQQSFAPAGAAVDLNALKEEIGRIIDAKVNDLAAKMQKYADQTDVKIMELHEFLGKLQVQASAPRESASNDDEPKKEAQQKLPSGRGVTENQRYQNAIDPKEVSIGKMFNFSNSNNGKIQRDRR